MSVVVEHPLFKHLRDFGWSISGTLDDQLDLSISTPHSLLKAEVRIVKDAVYKTSATLSAHDQIIVKRDYTSSTQKEVLDDLGRKVISLFGAYITGATNERDILEVYRRYRV